MFFRAVLCTEQLLRSCRMVFRMFLACLIFNSNSQFCKGYRLCMGYSHCKMAFLEYLVSLRAVVCTKHVQCSCRIAFCMFLKCLIFDRNWPFCKGHRLCVGYSLCKMADFQNLPISGIFNVFSSGLLHLTNLMLLYHGFLHVFGMFNFWPNWPFCKGYIAFAWAIAFAR